MAAYADCYTVYSCNNGSWKKKDFPCDWNLDLFDRSVSVDGCLYSKEDNGEIICFDPRDGKLHKLREPEGVEFLVLVELKAVTGRLCLYGFNDYGEQRLQLWVMEENGSFDKCWRKLISMEKEKPYMWNLRPVCLSNEDDVVLCGDCKYEGEEKDESHNYFIYNSRRFQEIEFTWERNSDFPDEYFPYSENLYMPAVNI